MIEWHMSTTRVPAAPPEAKDGGYELTLAGKCFAPSFPRISAMPLRNKIQRPIESTFAVHVLSIFALEYDVHLADIVALHLFAFRRIKATEAHRLKHLLLLGRFALEFGFRYHGLHLWSTA